MLWFLLPYCETVLHIWAEEKEGKQTYEIWYKELKHCIYKEVRKQVNED